MAGLIGLFAFVFAIYAIYKIAMKTFLWVIDPLVQRWEERDTPQDED